MRLILPLLLVAAPAFAQDGSIVRCIGILLEKEGNRSASDQELRKELLRRQAEDQKARLEMIEAGKKEPLDIKVFERVGDVDKDNREWLKGVIDKKGWPGIKLVGFDGASAAWLIAQHADADIEFQKRVLKLLEDAVKRKNARAVHLAYLTDRVLCAEGKKQLYGTQFLVSKDGKLTLKPVDDEAEVERRRAELGLGSLAESRKQMEKLYGKKDK